MTEPNGSVSYTVKELVAQLHGKMDTVILELTRKADRDDLKELAGRVDSLERSRDTQTGSTTLTRWALPVFVALIAIGANIAVNLLR